MWFDFELGIGGLGGGLGLAGATSGTTVKFEVCNEPLSRPVLP